MVDGSRPKKFISPFEPMFANTAYHSGGASGINLEIVQVEIIPHRHWCLIRPQHLGSSTFPAKNQYFFRA